MAESSRSSEAKRETTATVHQLTAKGDEGRRPAAGGRGADERAPQDESRQQAEMLDRARRVVIVIHFDGTAEDARRKGYDHRVRLDIRAVAYGERDSREIRTDYENTPLPTLNRWAVNWLRHQRSDYEHLQHLFGRVGAHEARLVIRDRVLDVVFERWPDLWPHDDPAEGVFAFVKDGTIIHRSRQEPDVPDYYTTMDDLKPPPMRVETRSCSRKGESA